MSIKANDTDQVHQKLQYEPTMFLVDMLIADMLGNLVSCLFWWENEQFYYCKYEATTSSQLAKEKNCHAQPSQNISPLNTSKLTNE